MARGRVETRGWGRAAVAALLCAALFAHTGAAGIATTVVLATAGALVAVLARRGG